MKAALPSRIVEGILGPAVPRRLPARIEEAIRHQDDSSEILIGWMQIAAILLFVVLYVAAPGTSPMEAPFKPVPVTLGTYAVFTVFRLMLAYRRRLHSWFLALSVVIDIAVLMVTIWSFHLQYGTPPALYLKSPTLLYVFIIVALRALRFDPKWVVLAGATAAAGWLVLLALALRGQPMSAVITHDYVEYMTSLKILVGAEIDKIISIVMVTAVLALAVTRGRRLLVHAVAEQMAVTELSRFFSQDVAATIIAADAAIRPGDGVLRQGAAMFIDLRGFTALSSKLEPRAVIELLGEYQHIVVTATHHHNGSIITYLGDGVMVTFGATRPSDSYAADALRATEELIRLLEAWAAGRRMRDLPAPRVGIGVASGTVTYGAIGDELRLEYAVLGPPVNTAAKLQAHTKIEGCHAMISRAAWDLAIAQGFVPSYAHHALPGQTVHGMGEPIDLMAIE